MDSIKEVLVDMKNEQIYAQHQLSDLASEMQNLDKYIRALHPNHSNINIAIQTH